MTAFNLSKIQSSCLYLVIAGLVFLSFCWSLYYSILATKYAYTFEQARREDLKWPLVINSDLETYTQANFDEMNRSHPVLHHAYANGCIRFDTDLFQKMIAWKAADYDKTTAWTGVKTPLNNNENQNEILPKSDISYCSCLQGMTQKAIRFAKNLAPTATPDYLEHPGAIFVAPFADKLDGFKKNISIVHDFCYEHAKPVEYVHMRDTIVVPGLWALGLLLWIALRGVYDTNSQQESDDEGKYEFQFSILNLRLPNWISLVPVVLIILTFVFSLIYKNDDDFMGGMPISVSRPSDLFSEFFLEGVSMNALFVFVPSAICIVLLFGVSCYKIGYSEAELSLTWKFFENVVVYDIVRITARLLLGVGLALLNTNMENSEIRLLFGLLLIMGLILHFNNALQFIAEVKESQNGTAILHNSIFFIIVLVLYVVLRVQTMVEFAKTHTQQQVFVVTESIFLGFLFAEAIIAEVRREFLAKYKTFSTVSEMKDVRHNITTFMITLISLLLFAGVLFTHFLYTKENKILHMTDQDSIRWVL